MQSKMGFEEFKSNVCHYLKECGDVKFIIDVLESNCIAYYFDNKQYVECFYILALTDYLSRLNNIELCNKYDNIRKYKLEKPLFSKSLRIADKMFPEKKLLDEAEKKAIPEFKRFNLIETEVRDVV